MNTNVAQQQAQTVAGWLTDGSLTLRQLMGLTDEEMHALAETADACRRRGQLNRALEIVSVLASIDPYRAHWWRNLALLHKSQGGYAEAVTCFEVAAICGKRDPQSVKQELACLEQLGELALVKEMTKELEVDDD